MTRLLAILARRLHVARGCICDPRFLDDAHDIECPIHGVPSWK